MGLPTGETPQPPGAPRKIGNRLKLGDESCVPKLSLGRVAAHERHGLVTMATECEDIVVSDFPW